MTTALTIISDALRESGILPLGGTPDADMQEEGLRRLNVLLSSFFGSEIGEKLSSASVGINGLTNSYAVIRDSSQRIETSFAPSNVRLYCNLSTAKTLFLDPSPQDGARTAVVDSSSNFSTFPLTLNANGRKIEGSSTVELNTSGDSREWFYRADLGTWLKITGLALTDPLPLPTEFEDVIIAYLTIRLNPRYGQGTSAELNETLRRIKAQFKARYTQSREMPSEPGLQIRPNYPQNMQSPSADTFNRGVISWIY
jgi:hypothetical protein